MALQVNHLLRSFIPASKNLATLAKQFHRRNVSGLSAVEAGAGDRRIHVRCCRRSTSSMYAPESPNSITAAPAALDSGLTLTPSCIKRLHEITTPDEPYLRITISGGGCSGFQYEFAMDSTVGSDDKFIGDEEGKALVVVDATSLSYVTGSTVDYYEELIRTGFRIISNPQAEGGCSCGASFSIKI